MELFGRELAKGKGTIKGRLYYFVFGHDHMGLRTRAMHVQRVVASLERPDQVLDAGSGIGCYSFYFAKKYPNARIIGVDVSDEKIENCKLIATRLGLHNLVFHKANLVHHSPHEEYDLICCIDVLEHIENDEKVLSNLRSAMKEGGIFLLHVPRKHSLWRHQFREFEEPADHVRNGYTEEDMVHKLHNAQFSILQVTHTFGRFGSLARELSIIIEELGSWRIVLKVILFPFLISFAWLDTLTRNRQHQGLLLVCSAAANNDESGDRIHLALGRR